MISGLQRISETISSVTFKTSLLSISCSRSFPNTSGVISRVRGGPLAIPCSSSSFPASSGLQLCSLKTFPFQSGASEVCTLEGIDLLKDI